MSALSAAQARLDGALQRLERALRATAAPRAEEDGAGLERDCGLLRRECDTLRQELAAANERAQRLGAVVVQVEDRIEGAIRRVDQLTGPGAAP